MRRPGLASALLAVLCAVTGPAVAGPVAHAKRGGCRGAEAIRSELFGRDTGRVLVVAHRGAHDVEPENSIAAIQRAIALGVAVVELDVRRTRDGHYVLMHDSTVDRTTDRKGKVSDLDWAELRRARLRTGEGRLTSARVPSFAEALDAARGRIWIMIDSKVDRPQDVAEIMAIARAHDVLGQTILYDYKLDVLAAYHGLAPEAKVLARTKDVSQIPDIMAIAHPDIFHIEPSYSSAEIAEAFDSRHVPTWINFIDAIDAAAAREGEEAGYDLQLSYRPDLVQTDRPAQLIALLRDRGLHPAALEPGGCTRP